MRPFHLSVGLIVATLLGGGCDRGKRPPPNNPPDTTTAGRPEPVKTDVDSLLAELRREKPTGSPDDEKTAALLRKHVPTDHPRRAEVFKALLDIGYAKKDPLSKDLLVRTAVPYADKAEIPALLDIPNHGPYVNLVWGNVLTRLAELKDPSCAEVVARSLPFDHGRTLHQREAAKVLRAIGPAAEPAVRPYARPTLPAGGENLIESRELAIEVLGDIGNEETVAFLQEQRAEAPPRITGAIDRAVKAIQSRKK